MKVETFETFVVGNPPPSFGGRYFIFVKLVADDGTVGYGEVYTATFNPHVVARMIEDVCERHVVGHDPFHVEALWRNVYGRGYTSRPDLSLISVLSGIEIAAGAIRLARALEPFDPMWFEPVPPDNIEEMARVARQTSIPIATGERLTTKYEFARVVEAQAAAILQPALGRSGGILETKKIAAIAETHHVQIAPHLYCGPIEALANIALATCTPNFLILESIQTFGGFYAELLTTPINWHHGYVIPPTGAGLGADLNEEVARANPYTDPWLHLEPQEHPHPSQ